MGDSEHRQAKNGGPCAKTGDFEHGAAKNGGPCAKTGDFEHRSAKNGGPCAKTGDFEHGAPKRLLPQSGLKPNDLTHSDFQKSIGAKCND